MKLYKCEYIDESPKFIRALDAQNAKRQAAVHWCLDLSREFRLIKVTLVEFNTIG